MTAVVATAGHVDHGKSSLLRCLTGREPDRLAEERRRGLTLDLGFVWTVIDDGTSLAFVDVPGHRRFVPTMLAGVGEVPAVLFVVAADEGWQEQSGEHLAALEALGVRHVVLAITRSDLADPGPALREATERLADSGLGSVPAVSVSSRTGAGIPELRVALSALARRLPVPDPDADVRLWIDRSFSMPGAGTVVTGTLGAGRLRVDQRLELSGRSVVIRGLQALEQPQDAVCATARVALNLRGVRAEQVTRGDPLLSPGCWRLASAMDVVLHPCRSQMVGGARAAVPEHGVLHIGSAAVPVRLRLLNGSASTRPWLARVTLARPLPMRVGDIAVIRDPGRHRIPAGLEVLDVDPPALARRGAAAARAVDLAAATGASERGSEPLAVRARFAALHLRRQSLVRTEDQRAVGLPVTGHEVLPGWRVDPGRWREWARTLAELLDAWGREHPLAPGMPAGAVAERLGIQVPLSAGQVTALTAGLAEAAGLRLKHGLLTRPGDAARLPPPVDEAVRELEGQLAAAPFLAPDAERLMALRLTPVEIAAAERAGRLVRLAPGVVLAPQAVRLARQELGGLAQPFTAGEARERLGTTRRVVIPLLERLDREGLTHRLPDGRREVRGGASG